MKRRTFLSGSALGAAGGILAGCESPAGKGDLSAAGQGEVDLKDRLLDCLGGPWPEPSELKAETGSVVRKNGLRIEEVSYEAEPGDRIQGAAPCSGWCGTG